LNQVAGGSLISEGLLSCNLYRGRFAGYKDALKKYGIPVDDELVFFHDLTAENGLKTGEKLFSSKPHPDAVFACNDTTAVSIIQYAKSLGIDIPSKLKVIGIPTDHSLKSSTPHLRRLSNTPARWEQKLL
jgi:LacI family transcriptional regulator